MKIYDDHSLCLKARIAPHCNVDSLKADMRSDCILCSTVGMRIFQSTATLRRGRLTNFDVKTGFIDTGQAERDVYGIPPREPADKGRCVLLLSTASYGLINAIAKWEVLSDSILTDMGFCQAPVILPLLALMQNEVLVAIIAKFVE